MSTSGPMMTLKDRQKCFEERKQLATNPCKMNHYITLDIDTAMLLTPESSPSNSSYQNSPPHHSPEALVAPPQPTRCSVLNMPPSPREFKQEQGSYMHQSSYSQVGSPQNSVGSPPIQLGSPYSTISSADSQMFSPQNQVGFEQMSTSPPHSQIALPPNQIGSPHFGSHSPSPYATNVRSPSQYSGHSSDHLSSSPQYTVQYPPPAIEEVHHMIPFSSAAVCSGIPVFDHITQEPAIYSTPGHPETYTLTPHQLPPFTHVFDNHIHEQRTQAEGFCAESGALPIKQIPNDFGMGPIDFYHPPTPPTPENHPTLMYHPEMCAPQMAEMCGPLTPLPQHLCPIATIPTAGRRRTKPVRKIPHIEVDDSDIKDIPTSSQLWEFTLRVLKKPKYKYMVSWEKREEGLFRFNNAQAFAALWGKHRNRPQMSYDKVARALRYYYKRNILEQVGGRLTYRFTKRLSKMYMSDV